VGAPPAPLFGRLRVIAPAILTGLKYLGRACCPAGIQAHGSWTTTRRPRAAVCWGMHERSRAQGNGCRRHRSFYCDGRPFFCAGAAERAASRAALTIRSLGASAPSHNCRRLSGMGFDGYPIAHKVFGDDRVAEATDANGRAGRRSTCASTRWKSQNAKKNACPSARPIPGARKPTAVFARSGLRHRALAPTARKSPGIHAEEDFNQGRDRSPRDEGSQLRGLAWSAGPRPGEQVIDLLRPGAGGKTLALGGDDAGQGPVDRHRSRHKRQLAPDLRAGCPAPGVHNLRPSSATPEGRGATR